MTTTQPLEADTDRKTPLTPVGADNGHGILKLVLGAGSGQMRVRCPAKFKEVREELTDIPTSKHGSIFYYQDGNLPHLIGQTWKTGELAYTADPYGHTKLSDDPLHKITYAPHAIFGALGTLPHRQVWNLHIVASIHNSKLFRDDLIKALEGKHTIVFNGNTSCPSTVNITISLVVPEGAGSYSYCRSERLIDQTKHVIAIDFGTGTIIPTVFAPGGAIDHREVLTIGGCIDLLDALARDKQIQLFEGGKAGDIELIRQGIESRSFQYGNTPVNFQEAYKRELTPWLKDRFSLAIKATRPWLKLAGSLIIWGGGAQLPGVAAVVEKYGWSAIVEGSWANALGLARIAEGRSLRGK